MPIWRRRAKEPTTPANPAPASPPESAAPPVGAPSRAVVRRLVDICIVFDTTGSMSGKIRGLIDSMAGFVDRR